MSYAFNQPLEIKDFSAGITDNFIDCAPNQYQQADNFLITNNKKLLSRDGVLVYDSVNPQIPAGNQRVGALTIHPSNQLFEQSLRDIYYISGGTFNTLLGPVDLNKPFSANSVSNFISQAIWRNHVYYTSDSFANPIKVYKDSSGAYQVRQAGLPGVDLQGAILLAIEVRDKYTDHIADAGEHTAGADTVNVITSPAPYDLQTLITFLTEFIIDYSAHEADAALPSGWAYHAGQETITHALTSSTPPTDVEECLVLIDDIKLKFNAHDADGSAHGTDTQHQLTVKRSPAVTSGGGSSSFIYGFFFKHTYTVGDVTFEVNSSVLLIETATNLSTGTKTIANLPSVSNGMTGNFDTATITLEIYRTEDGGTTLYKVASVNNGTGSYSDATSDADLVLNPVIYTDGGVLDDELPAPAKYISIVNDIACYASIKTGSISYPTRYGFSRPGSPDAYLSSSEDDIEESITAVNNIGIYHILFSLNRVYRLEGIIDSLGRGNVDKREITREHGCISNRSVVKIPGALIYAGQDGFYVTDGYKVNGISRHLNDSYKNLVQTDTQKARIYGRYDKKENRVYFFMSALSTSTDNDIAWVLDLNFSNLMDEKQEGGVFTTLSNNSSWLAASCEFVNDVLILGDSRGYILKFDSQTVVDPKIDTTVTAANWNTSAIIWNHKSISSTFGSSTLFKFVPSITAQFKNLGNATPQIKSNNEDSNNYVPLKEIRIRDGITWGDSGTLWGTADILWNVLKISRSMRRFPLGQLRSIYKQIQIKNSKTNIYNSDTYGTANTSGAANTLTLTDVTKVLPLDIVGYLVTLSNDSYTKEYTVITRNSATLLTVSDPDGDFSTVSASQWIIKGFRKKERLNILSYSLNYAVVGENQPVYRGENGANAT